MKVNSKRSKASKQNWKKIPAKVRSQMASRIATLRWKNATPAERRKQFLCMVKGKNKKK